MASKPRHSKFKNVDVRPYKSDRCMQNINFATGGSSDSSICDVSGKFIAVILEVTGGGSFLVFRTEEFGRFELGHPKVCGHTALVTDIKWSPFSDNIIASCSEDATVKTWIIPDGGLTEDMRTCVTSCQASKKLTSLAWHPTAENIISAVCQDYNVYIWRSETSDLLFTLEHPNLIFSLAWNFDGSMLATACKDKVIRCWNPRKQKILWEAQGHKGTKASRVCFSGSLNLLVSTGFGEKQQREVSLWVNPTKAVTMTLDTTSAVLFPFFDEGTHVLAVLGKGDTTIRFYGIYSGEPYIQFLTLSQSSEPMKGFGFLSRSAVDIAICEIDRVYVLIKKSVQPNAIIVPRKSSGFQDDIFVYFEAKEPSLNADEWISGKTLGRKMIKYVAPGAMQEPSFIVEVQTSGAPATSSDGTLGSKTVTGSWEGSSGVQSYDKLKKDYEAKCAQVTELESQLKSQSERIEGLVAELESLKTQLQPSGTEQEPDNC